MNDQPPSHDPPDDLDHRYRRASELDASRPSESARRAVLDYAARQAAERREQDTPANVTRLDARRKAPGDEGRHTTARRWQRPAIFGTLAAAVLAGLLVVPRFLTEPSPPAASVSTRTTEAANAPSLSANQPPSSLPSPSPPRRDAPSDAFSATAPPHESYAFRAPRAKAASPPREENDRQLQRLTERPPDVPAGTSAAENAATAAPSAVAGAAQPSPYAPAPSAPTPRAPMPQLDGLTGGYRAPLGLNSSRLGAATASAQAGKPAVPPLHRAAQAGDLAELQKMLDSGADINGRDSAGRTALLVATLAGKAPAVDALLRRGADPNIADGHGNTPLEAALAADLPDIVDSLERAGAR